MLGGNLGSEVYYEFREGAAILSLCRPVANTLSSTMRVELFKYLENAYGDVETKGVILRGIGACFSAGLDLAEYDDGLSSPNIAELCTLIEDGPKPVVMALHGSALGAGFELALAGSTRIAKLGTTVALPELSYGLIPCGGTTQRLPRLIGAHKSLEFLLTGRELDVSDPLLEGAIDLVTELDPTELAVQLVKELSHAGQWPQTNKSMAGFADPFAYQQAMNAAAQRLVHRDGAVDCLLRCIEAAQLLPFSQGLALEQSALEDLRVSSSARAQRHLYLAEKKATMIQMTTSPGRQEQTVVFIGQNKHLGALVSLCHSRGADVVLLDADVETAMNSHQQIKAIYEQAVDVGQLSADASADSLSRLSAGTGFDVMKHADIVFDMFKGVADVDLPALKDTCVWVAIDGNEPGGRFDENPVVTLCFPEFGDGIRFAEIATAEGAGQGAVDTVARFFGGKERILLRTDAASGGIANRLQSALFLAALEMVAAGKTPQEVDEAAMLIGLSLGPFHQIDEIGLSNVAIQLDRYLERHGVTRTSGLSLLVSRISDSREHSGAVRGFYLLGVADPALLPWLEDWRRHNSHPSAVSCGADDVALALHGALLNEAVRLFDENAVRRVSDIDVTSIASLQMERNTGGPLFLSDLQGLLPIVLAMQQWAKVVRPLWEPHATLRDMVNNGKRFY